jgi:hypothetical protein
MPHPGSKPESKALFIMIPEIAISLPIVAV